MFNKNDLVILTKDVTYGNNVFNNGMIFAVKQYDDRIKTALLVNNKQQVLLAMANEFEAFIPDCRINIPLAVWFDSYSGKSYTLVMTSNHYYVRVDTASKEIGYITDTVPYEAFTKAASWVHIIMTNCDLIWTNPEYIK